MIASTPACQIAHLVPYIWGTPHRANKVSSSRLYFPISQSLSATQIVIRQTSLLGLHERVRDRHLCKYRPILR
jgi:hypothetical protein